MFSAWPNETRTGISSVCPFTATTDHRRRAVLRLIVRRARCERRFQLDDLVVDSEFLGGLRGDERDVVPSELGNRIRSFLQASRCRSSDRRRSRSRWRKSLPANPWSGAVATSGAEMSRTRRRAHNRIGGTGEKTVAQEFLPCGIPFPAEQRRTSRGRRCRRAMPRLFHLRH